VASNHRRVLVMGADSTHLGSRCPARSFLRQAESPNFSAVHFLRLAEFGAAISARDNQRLTDRLARLSGPGTESYEIP